MGGEGGGQRVLCLTKDTPQLLSGLGDEEGEKRLQGGGRVKRQKQKASGKHGKVRKANRNSKKRGGGHRFVTFLRKERKGKQKTAESKLG